MPPASLFRRAVERNLDALRADLGQADQTRLAALPPIQTRRCRSISISAISAKRRSRNPTCRRFSIIQASPGAWRDVGWLVPDAAGALTRYPAEVFGPLPEYRENRTPPQ